MEGTPGVRCAVRMAHGMLRSSICHRCGHMGEWWMVRLEGELEKCKVSVSKGSESQTNSNWEI